MKKTKTINIYGFNITPMKLEDFLNNTKNKETLKILKVQGYTFLHRPETNELYAVSEPKQEVSDGQSKTSVQ